MSVKIEKSWEKILESQFKQTYFKNLIEFIRIEYQNYTCYPKGDLIFHSFNSTSFYDVKVVILGQDPYHGKGQANGLCFSVNDDIALPPSLKNIFLELKNDLGIEKHSGNLQKWSKQGVFLLNTTLTVRKNQSGSHQGKGWEIFTDHVIEKISSERDSIVFILWGKFAQQKYKFINTQKHYVIQSVHPSPFSCHRGFFDSRPFSKTNKFLLSRGLQPIDWR